MQYRLTTLIAACTLFAHSIFGCCWHVHAHEIAEAVVANDHSATVTTCCSSKQTTHSERDGHAPAAPESQSECPEPVCEHSECSFVAVRAADWDLLSAESLLVSTPVTEWSVLSVLVEGIALGEGWTDSPVRESGGRARADLQVWVM